MSGDDTVYNEVFLDANSFPHLTGYEIVPPAAAKITPNTKWAAPNKHYQTPYSGDDAAEEEEIKTSVGPPATQAFPLNEGWHLPGQTPRKPSPDAHGDDLRRLTDLSIHEITRHLTSIITKDVRPNCENAWATRLSPQTIPWKKVWASIGTPLSDPTEEKAWRKLLHRAINARNRHPNSPDKTCRLQCGCADESMLHLIECCHARPMWEECAKFIQNTLGGTTHFDFRMLVIFNLADPTTLVSIPARALIRHLVQAYYRDLTNIELHKSNFSWQLTFNSAIRSFRDAVLRWGFSHKLLYTTRKYTNLTSAAPKKDRQQFGTLIEVTNAGDTKLTPALTEAVASAAAAAANRIENDRAARSRPRPRPP